jgi:hypothetical protein
VHEFVGGTENSRWPFLVLIQRSTSYELSSAEKLLILRREADRFLA